jgi:Flp pilus assembly protein TadG
LAIVEFTIVLPICLMLIMATAEFGRAFMQYNTLTKAVRDGARYAAGKSLPGSAGVVTISAELETETRNLVVHGNVFGTGSPVLPGLAPGNVTVAEAGDNVVVTAAYPYNAIFGFVPRFFYGGEVDASGYSLQTAVTMRAL